MTSGANEVEEIILKMISACANCSLQLWQVMQENTKTQVAH